ncbi:MAG TPA: hypothetical protein VII11_00365 [Bacteroidota bacterium]
MPQGKTTIEIQAKTDSLKKGGDEIRQLSKDLTTLKSIMLDLENDLGRLSRSVRNQGGIGGQVKTFSDQLMEALGFGGGVSSIMAAMRSAAAGPVGIAAGAGYLGLSNADKLIPDRKLQNMKDIFEGFTKSLPTSLHEKKNLLEQVSGYIRDLNKSLETESLEIQHIQEINRELNILEDIQRELRGQVRDLTENQQEERTTVGKETPKTQKQTPRKTDFTDRASNPQYAGTDLKSLFAGGMGPGKATKVSTTPPTVQRTVVEAIQSFEKLNEESKAFASAFESGMQGVGSAIQRSLGTAFERVFGEANSLLEAFVQNALKEIAQILIQLGIRSALNAAFSGSTVPTPMDLTGDSWTKQEFGGIATQAATLRQSVNTLQSQNFELKAEVLADRLVVMLESGARSRAKRRA